MGKVFRYVFRLIIITAMFIAAGKAASQPALFAYPEHVVLWRASVSAAIFLSAGTGLYAFADQAYYQDQRCSFHWARLSDGHIDWFNNAYGGMDKFGHIYSASLFSENFYVLSRWSGFNQRQSNWLAPLAATFILGGMEMWDAHFKSWGFSPGDFMANLVGAAWPVLQTNYRFFSALDYKLSYDFRARRHTEKGAHDYRRMTFWLSANPAALWPKAQKIFPEWLNVAVGVGLESYQRPERQIFIAPDINLKKLAGAKGFLLRQLIRIVDRFRLPLPALRLTPKLAFYLIYF